MYGKFYRTKVTVGCVLGVAVIISVLLALYNHFVKKQLEFHISEYYYESMTEVLSIDNSMGIDASVYYKDNFKISQNDFVDIQENSDEYFLVSFWGTLTNYNSPTVYYWRIYKTSHVSDNKNWVSKEDVSYSGTEIISGCSRPASIQVIIKCKPHEVDAVCDGIIENQPFGASGFWFVE